MNFKELTNMDPVEFFQKLSDKEKNVCFLHTADKKGKSILAWNPTETYVYKNNGRGDFQKEFDTFAKRNRRRSREVIGYFSYDLAYELLNVKKTAKDDLKLPDVYFYAFDNRIVFENGSV
jgi:anthranilate/para-aminobenzoate synthase component I